MAAHPVFYTNANAPNYAWLGCYRDLSSFPVMNVYISPEDDGQGMITLASWCLVTDITNLNNVSHTVTPTLSNANYLTVFGEDVTDLRIQGVTFANITPEQLTREESKRLNGQSTYTDATDLNMLGNVYNAPPSGLSALYRFYIANRIRTNVDMSQDIGKRPWMKHINIVIFKQTTSTTRLTGRTTVSWNTYPVKIKGFLYGLEMKITDSVLMRCDFSLNFKALDITKAKNHGFTEIDVINAASQKYYTTQ